MTSRTRLALMSGDIGGLETMGVSAIGDPGLFGLLKRVGGAIVRRGRGAIVAHPQATRAAKVAVAAAAGAAIERLGRRGKAKPTAAECPFHRKRRGRGITARELRGFNKVARLLARVGMVPRRLGGRARVHHKT